jgi:hypothetical protein
MVKPVKLAKRSSSLDKMMREKKLITKRIALLVAIIQIELFARNDSNLINIH